MVLRRRGQGCFASYGFVSLTLDIRTEDQERLAIGEAERVVAQTYCAFRAGVVKVGVRTPSGSGRVFGSLS